MIVQYQITFHHMHECIDHDWRYILGLDEMSDMIRCKLFPI